jgi:hypothetical protein
MARFHEMFSYILYGKTVGSGHFCQLEVPKQVNAMIDRFLAVTLPRWHARQNGLSRSVASSRLMPTLTPAGR